MTLAALQASFVTPAPWHRALQHPQYGDVETYRRAADWLSCCATVADWGGSTGFFKQCLPSTVQYVLVDGTVQVEGQFLVLADLERYYAHSEGILLRHVLDCTQNWPIILRNALAAFQKRLVVVTFTPDAAQTAIVKMKSRWPIVHFNPADLRREMGDLLVRDEAVSTSHPERVFYLERR